MNNTLKVLGEQLSATSLMALQNQQAYPAIAKIGNLRKEFVKTRDLKCFQRTDLLNSSVRWEAGL